MCQADGAHCLGQCSAEAREVVGTSPEWDTRRLRAAEAGVKPPLNLITARGMGLGWAHDKLGSLLRYNNRFARLQRDAHYCTLVTHYRTSDIT